MRLVLSALQSAGISRTSVRLWAAHYTGESHLCTPDDCGYALSASVDATQWTDHALGLKLDESVCSDSFFGPPPPPPDPNHYDCYSRGPFPFRSAEGKLGLLDERAIQDKSSARSTGLSTTADGDGRCSSRAPEGSVWRDDPPLMRPAGTAQRRSAVPADVRLAAKAATLGIMAQAASTGTHPPSSCGPHPRTEALDCPR